jgi:putative Mg2+ transporter-C (MgtC) family protein
MLIFLDMHNNMKMISADPIRVLNALILGVSFVGAGTILKLTEQKKVTGLPQRQHYFIHLPWE